MNRPITLRHVLALLCAAACSTSLEIPDSTRITCASDADCFNGRRCLIDIRECVDPLQSCAIEVVGGFGSVANGTSCTQRSGESGVCLGGQCLTSACGDAYLDPSAGEECDSGAQNSDTTPNACRTNCRSSSCGDGVLDDGKEVCDDGNAVSGDGCRADCKKIELCNDAELDAGEACDDANDNPNDGCDACRATAWVPEVLVGRGAQGTTPGTVTFSGLGAIIADLDRRLYVADSNLCRVVRIDPANDSVSVVAGSGTCGSSGALQGQIARGTDLGPIRALAIHPDGALYIADGLYIHRIDPVSGRMTHIAGNGQVCNTSTQLCVSGGQATFIPLGLLRDMDFDAAGNLYTSDHLHVVREITPTGQSYVLVGTINTAGNAFAPDASGGDVLLNEPAGIAVTPNGQVYVADTANHRILRYDALNDLTTLVAGTGVQGSAPDGSVAATSPIRFSGNLAALERRVSGEIVYVELSKVRAIDLTGVLRTIGGTGNPGSSGDGGPPLSANMSPQQLTAIDGGGLAFGETVTAPSQSLRVRVIEGGVIRSVVSTVPSNGLVLGQAHTATPLPSMKSFDIAVNGDIYVTINSGLLRATQSTGVFELIAGNGTQLLPDGIPGTQARFTLLTNLRVRPNGDVYVVDSFGNAVYRVDGGTRVITRVVGTGIEGFAGDGGAARDAQLDTPCDIDFASSGDMYVFDCGNYRIRKVDAVTGNITTIAGNGTQCSTSTCGDGGPLLQATFGFPDPQSQRATIRVIGNGETIVFSDRGTYKIRVISGSTIQTLVGTGAPCNPGFGVCGDGGAGTSATLSLVLGGIALDDGGLLIADSRLRRVDSLTPGAVIRNVANVNGPFSGDGGSPLTATGAGGGMVQRTADGIYLNSFGPSASSLTIRKIASGTITTVAGLVDAVGDGPIATSELTHPVAMTAIAPNRWLVADGEPGRIRLVDTAGGRVSTVAGYPGGFSEVALPGDRARYVQLLQTPAGITADTAHQLAYIIEEGANRIRTLDFSDAAGAWTIDTYAGTTQRGHADGPLAGALFDGPRGAAYDATRDVLWVADAGNHVIRRIDVATGVVSTLAGQPHLRGFAGDGRGAGDAYFSFPSALAVDAVDGSLYVADTGNNRVRRIIADVSGELSTASIVETVLGDGSPSASGSGAPARAFPAQQPNGVAFDRYGDLLVTSTSSVRIVNAGADGVPSGEDFVQTIYGAPPRDTFPENVTSCLTGVSSPDGDGTLDVLDGCLGYVLRLTRQAQP